MLKRALITVVLMSTLGGLGGPAAAEIVVRVAPPPVRSEMVPAPRRGYIWTPGHWEWRRQQHVWVGGAWLRDRPGYMYRNPEWRQRDGRWVMQHGGWVRGGHDRGRDRDHDGYRDGGRHDRDGYRDGQRGHGDRDGDGVPNNRDARPNNPNLR